VRRRRSVELEVVLERRCGVGLETGLGRGLGRDLGRGRRS